MTERGTTVGCWFDIQELRTYWDFHPIQRGGSTSWEGEDREGERVEDFFKYSLLLWNRATERLEEVQERRACTLVGCSPQPIICLRLTLSSSPSSSLAPTDFVLFLHYIFSLFSLQGSCLQEQQQNEKNKKKNQKT